jgi:hypothetical protein
MWARFQPERKFGIGSHLATTGRFKVAPGAGDLHRPVGQAMITHDRLLLRVHRLVLSLFIEKVNTVV